MKIELLEDLIGEGGKRKSVHVKKNTARLLSQPKNDRQQSQGGVKARVAGISARKPEVLVKISGFSKGGSHVKANLTYISRHGKLDIENERGELISGRKELHAFADDWMADINDHRRRKNQRDTMHLVLSMPGSAHALELYAATRHFAEDVFGNHEYVFAMHSDTNNRHCHLIVKCRGFDGKQLHVKRGDPQTWREIFAQHLRAEGVEAEATPRLVRGVTRRAEKQALRHIDDPDPKDRPPRISKVRRALFAEAVAELKAEQRGQKLSARPREEKSRHFVSEVRHAWIRAAQALEARTQAVSENLPTSEAKSDAELAKQMRRFAASIPDPVSPIEQVKAQVRAYWREKKAGQSQIVKSDLEQRRKDQDNDLDR